MSAMKMAMSTASINVVAANLSTSGPNVLVLADEAEGAGTTARCSTARAAC